MAGSKGSFKCGKDHRLSEHLTREEVTEAIKKLKARHKAASLSKDENAYIADKVAVHENEGEGSD